MPCLKQMVRVNDVIRDKMRVSSPPPPSTVVANLRRISPSTLERWPLSEKVTAVFGRIFAHLWSKWGEVGEVERQELRGMAVIPVGGDLLRPSRVFFRLEGSFAPLMFELPRVYGAHEPLLRQLGVREAPSPRDLNSFLLEVGSESASSPLNPNELCAVVRVLDALSSSGYSPGGAGSRALLVPDTAGIMVEASDCFRCDDAALLRRVLVSSIHMASPLLSPEVCGCAGVRDLGQAITEMIEGADGGEGGEGEMLFVRGADEDSMRERLHSFELAEAIIAMLSGAGARVGGDSIAGNDEKWITPESARAFLSRYGVRIARRLSTRLLLPSGEDITSDQGNCVTFFIDRPRSLVILSQVNPRSPHPPEGESSGSHQIHAFICASAKLQPHIARYLKSAIAHLHSHLSHTYTRTHARTHTHTSQHLSLSPSLSLSLTHTPAHGATGKSM